MNSKSKFKTLVIIDLETTGLIYDEPKVTELAMIAVNIATLEDMKVEDELPRVLNKYVKLFNPVKLLRTEVVEMTGLNNRVLMDCAPFNRETVIAMEAFLSDFQKPMCFIAHNGYSFDFPILFSEIKSAFYSNTSSATTNNSNHNECISEMNSTMSNDQISILSSSTKDSSIQTLTSNVDYNQISLLSIECVDSLVFFREMYRLLNDKDIVQYPMETTLSEHPIILNQNECHNNVSVESTSSSETSTNHNSSSRVGYVEIPLKYVPSKDPARQQPSMKLVKIYEREFNQNTSHLKSHRAEDDCLMLLAILKRYLPDLLEWIEVNHQPLSNFSSLPFTSAKPTLSKPILHIKRPLPF